MKSIEMLDIPEFDYLASKRAVYKVIRKYQRALNKLYLKSYPKMTTTFTIVPPTFTNEFHSSTEEAALYADSDGAAFKQYVEYVENAANSISEKYRVLIYRCLLLGESDVKVANDLHYSPLTLRWMRKEAIELFAYALGVDCYK